MPLLYNQRTVLVKIESSYGVDASPTGSANAVQCRNLDIVPLEAQNVSRDLVRPYYGNSDQLPTAVYGKISLEVEMAGSGTAGTAPAWGPLLRACGVAETVLAAAHTGTAQSGSTATTIKLAAGASASNNAYLGMAVRTTGGTGSGQKKTIIAYDGATKVATVEAAWTATPDTTTTYSVDANVVYAPVSSGFDSTTIYFNLNGVLHKTLGSRGSVAMVLANNQIPVFKFEFSGLYVPVADAVAPTVVFTAWRQPLPCNKTNTPVLNIHGYTSASAENLEFNFQNDVQFRSLIGSGSDQVLITNRKPSGSISVEATTVTARDWWTSVRNASLGAVVVEHGTSAGNTIRITAPATQLTGPKYSESQGVAMMQADTVLLPISGNDEIMISSL